MALLPNPFDTLLGLQQALDAFHTSGWLGPSPSSSGGFPPLNAFRKGEDYIIVTELPGVKKSDLDVQIKHKTIRISGTKSVNYGENETVLSQTFVRWCPAL
jgi:HSP20 family protein